MMAMRPASIATSSTISSDTLMQLTDEYRQPTQQVGGEPTCQLVTGVRAHMLEQVALPMMQSGTWK